MRCICIILLTILPSLCFAQRDKRINDSLLALVKSPANLVPVKEAGIRRMLIFKKLANKNLFTEPGKALSYADSALRLARDNGDKGNQAEASFLAGRSCLMLNDLPAGMQYLLKARELSEISGNQHLIGQSNFYIGLIMSNSGNQDGAKDAYHRAIVAARLSNDSTTLAYTYGNLVFMSPYEEGERYGKESIRITEAQGDLRQTTLQRTLLAGFYISNNQPEKALPYVLKNLKYLQQTKDSSLSLDILSTLGHVYSRMGKTKEAVQYYMSALAEKRELTDVGSLFAIYEHLPYILYDMGDYKQSARIFKDYIQTLLKFKNDESSVRVNELNLQEAFKRKQYTDSLNTAKEKELTRLKLRQQRALTYTGLGGVLMLALLLFFIYRNFRTQKNLNTIISHEKQKSDELLLNILPAEVADELKAKGFSEARLFDEVTVLFTDFTNFTGVSEHLSPQQLVEELHICFSSFDRIMGKYGLEKIKTIGDAYLAVAGLPHPVSDHAVRSVKAAREILAFMHERRMEKGTETFGIRIGIHTGSVVGGIVGIKKFAYDIWGDTVNTAARMEQHGESGKINISQQTYEQVKDVFVCHPRGSVAAKNKGMLPMYYVE